MTKIELRSIVLLLLCAVAHGESVASLHFCPGDPGYYTDEITRSRAHSLKCRLVQGSPQEEETGASAEEKVPPGEANLSLAARMAAVESKPSQQLKKSYRTVDNYFRKQQIAWTAGACRIRSTEWYMQMRQLYYIAYDMELAENKFKVEELAVLDKRALIATSKAKSEFPFNDSGCAKLARSTELNSLDESWRRTTAKYR